MTSKSTQIWTTLRHLALVCVIVVGVLSILATGGGGGNVKGGGGGGPTLADLEGVWFGTLSEGNNFSADTISIRIDGSGNMFQVFVNSADTGLQFLTSHEVMSP